LEAPPAWSGGGGGCPEAYAAGTAYGEGDVVAVAGSNWGTVYQCADGPSHQFCGANGFAPDGPTSNGVWTELGSCSGTIAPSKAPVFDAASDVGCPGAWTAGTVYSAGDTVSLTPEGANRGVVYRCKADPDDRFCGMEGFRPDGPHGADAWEREPGFCSGTVAPTLSPVFDAASDVGCPAPYAAGTSYEPDDTVSLTPDGANRGVVYKCREEPFNRFCGMVGHEPDGPHGEEAWERVGFCSGTIAPTSAPVYDAASDAGCPEAYVAGMSYVAGDMASVTPEGGKRGVIYRCREEPLDRFCGMTGHEPDGQHGEEAWELVGFCSGTITPTVSPVYVNLPDAGGCPGAWEAGGVDKYEGGDLVGTNGLVFSCKEWPDSARCAQPGYEPLSVGDHWKEAWDLQGHCKGTKSPSASPVFSPGVAACPPDWTSKDYEEGDLAAVTVSTNPPRKVTYICKAWPLSQFCKQFSPDSVPGGEQGWVLAGSCDAGITFAPTGAPVFVSLAEVAGGCPEDYAPGGDGYEAGDRVAYAASDESSGKVVYECRPYPASMWCGQAVFAPGEQHADMAWTVLGHCKGTIAPTLAPVPYAGKCKYTMVTETLKDCACGDAGCPNPGGLPDGGACSKTVTVKVKETVGVYDASATYVAGEVVRVGLNRYKCKPWPYVLWCNNEAYKPVPGTGGPWTEAWVPDGVCA